LASPDVVLTTSYEALMAVAEGEINLEDFAANHCEIEVQTAGKEADLFVLLSAAIAVLRDEPDEPHTLPIEIQ
ncbi:MAG: hypothetical protein GY788_09855, partial [bacterium]|nr:hypothetical protein [bacterium]